MSDVQHINVKLFAEGQPDVHWEGLIPVFHRWIQNKAVPETTVDVTDYAHVPAGPGVLLIAHEAFYSLDNRENRIGFLYNRRTALEGSTVDKLQQAYSSALLGAKMLEAEPEFAGKLQFRPHHCEVTVNDRALAPNTEDTWGRLRPAFEEFFTGLFGSAPKFERNPDPRSLLRVRVSPS